MDEIWSNVVALKGQTIKTVTGHPLTVDGVTDSYVVVTPVRTGTPRRIDRYRVEKAYALKSNAGSVRPSHVRAAGVSEFSPAYVAALVNAIP